MDRFLVFDAGDMNNKYIRAICRFLAFLFVWIIGCAIMDLWIQCDARSWSMVWGIVVFQFASAAGDIFD